MLPVRVLRLSLSPSCSRQAPGLLAFVSSSSLLSPAGPSCCAAFVSKAHYSFFSRNKKKSTEEEFDFAKEGDATSTKGNSELVTSTGAEVSLTDRGPLPMITKRELNYLPYGRTPRQAWVENLDTVKEEKLGLVDLHPDVFGTWPRVELINSNVAWQKNYRKVNWDWMPTRGECRGTGAKPWPQKGLGKARHGSKKSPIWIKGAKAHGPRGPKTYFNTLYFDKRLHGLCSTLSVKLAQDDLKIVDNIDIPTDDPKYLEDLVAERAWGISVLFVDDTDIVPKNIALATDSISHMNIMPAYGLNVYSMLKHETLVLTLAALNRIEEKLVFHLNRHDPFPPTARKTPGGNVLHI